MKIFKIKRLTKTKLSKLAKLFSKSKSEIDKFIEVHRDKFFERVFKILILGNRCKLDIPHWCSLICGDLNQLEKYITPTKMFLPLVDNYKGLPRRYGKVFVTNLRSGKTSNEFAESIKEVIKSVKKSEEPKYSSVYKTAENSGEVPDNETLIQMTKFVVLCLTGQMNIKDHNWYDPEVQTMEVDWNRRVSPTAKMLEEIFKSVLGMDK